MDASMEIYLPHLGGACKGVRLESEAPAKVLQARSGLCPQNPVRPFSQRLAQSHEAVLSCSKQLSSPIGTALEDEKNRPSPPGRNVRHPQEFFALSQRTPLCLIQLVARF